MSGRGVVVDFAKFHAIIGGEFDPLRAVWDERASTKDRRLLVAMAGGSVTLANLYAGRSWCDLPAEMRCDIAGGLRRFKEWAGRL